MRCVSAASHALGGAGHQQSVPNASERHLFADTALVAAPPPDPRPERRYSPTPTMAAGKADHGWALTEIAALLDQPGYRGYTPKVEFACPRAAVAVHPRAH